MMRMSPPRPVMVPSMPTAYMPPWWPWMWKRDTAAESEATVTPKVAGPNSVMMLRTLRPQSVASRPE
jgi:hypothetical protein